MRVHYRSRGLTRCHPALYRSCPFDLRGGIDNRQTDVNPLGWSSPTVVLLQTKKRNNRENLLTASWQQFLANFRSGQGKQRVPECTHKAAFLTAHSPCLTHVVVLLLLLCLNYVNNFLPQYGYAWASVVPVIQCLSSFA
jgi:hypothetical protein